MLQLHRRQRLQHILVDRERLEALNHRLNKHQVAIQHNKEQRRQRPVQATHRTGLRTGSRVEKSRKSQTHLETDDLPGQFECSKDQPYRKANGQSDRHLLRYCPKSLWTIDADDRLIRKAWLCGERHQQCQTNLRA